MSRPNGVLATLLVIGLATLWWTLARGAFLAPTPTALSPAALEATESRGVVLGSADAPARVVFFSDYQCGACAALELAVWDSLHALSDRGLASVRVLHTPLRAHRRAPRAAELHACSVGMAAGWEVHRRLFETRFDWAQGPPPDPVFQNVARAAGLDSAALAACLVGASDFVETPGFLDSVSISGVPTVAVNGRAVLPTAPALLAEIDRVLRVAGAERAPDQVPACRVVAPIARELRARVEAACKVAADRMAEKLAITPAYPTFTIGAFGEAAASPDPALDHEVVRLVSLDSIPTALRGGIFHHEVAHLVVDAWLGEALGPDPLSGAPDEYGSRLPDLLDDGLAILGEPRDSREARRHALAGIDPQPLDVTFATVHPGLEAVQEAGTSRTTRSVRSPCRGECLGSHPDQWMVVTERWTANPGGPDSYAVDTAYFAEGPPEPEVEPLERFYTLAEAVISFLEEELGEPARLRDFVLALLAPGDPVDSMDELERRLGVSQDVIESRWSEWVRRAQEAAG